MDEPVVTHTGGADNKSLSAMQERVELLEMAESIAAVGHWQIDLKAGQLFWSDEIYRIHGVTPQTYTPDIESAIDFYHRDDATRVAALIDSAISDKRPFDFEFRLVRRDGSVRHVQSRARLTLSDDGEVETVFGVFQDVTERLATKEALHASQTREESFRAAVNAVLTMPDLGSEQKNAQMLNLACAYLNLDEGNGCQQVDGFGEVEFSSSACADADSS